MNNSIFMSIILYFFTMSSARAEEAFSFGVIPKQYIHTGVTAGTSFVSNRVESYLGLECNYTQFRRNWWMGGYTDVFYDFGQESMVITAGPRIGKLVFGVDGGLGMRVSTTEQVELGWQARTMFTTGLFSLYYRFGSWPTSDGDDFTSTHQTGVTVNIPFKLEPTASLSNIFGN